MNERDDTVMKALKARFFSLIAVEDIGKTPQVTKELDNLTEAIREMQQTQIATI